MKINILVTGISSSNSISFVKGLRKQNEIDFTITGTDIYNKAFSPGARFVDKFSKVPYASDPHYIPFLINICKKNNIHIVVPIIDEEFIPISNAREQFLENNTKIMLPGHNQLLTCRDKYQTYLFFKENGVSTPETSLTPDRLKKYPVLVKPRFGRGSKNIKTISCEEEAKKLFTGEYILQEIVEGQEYTIDTLSDRKGKIVAAVPRVRLEIRNGVSYKAKTVRNKILEQYCTHICETLGLVGPACIQCIVTEQGKPYFFEINPRIGSAVTLTIRAGVNIPLMAVKNMLGIKLDNLLGKFDDNVIMLRYWEEIFVKENSVASQMGTI